MRVLPLQSLMPYFLAIFGFSRSQAATASSSSDALTRCVPSPPLAVRPLQPPLPPPPPPPPQPPAAALSPPSSKSWTSRFTPFISRNGRLRSGAAEGPDAALDALDMYAAGSSACGTVNRGISNRKSA